jgi:hypothetical protein
VRSCRRGASLLCSRKLRPRFLFDHPCTVCLCKQAQRWRSNLSGCFFAVRSPSLRVGAVSPYTPHAFIFSLSGHHHPIHCIPACSCTYGSSSRSAGARPSILHSHASSASATRRRCTCVRTCSAYLQDDKHCSSSFLLSCSVTCDYPLLPLDDKHCKFVRKVGPLGPGSSGYKFEQGWDLVILWACCRMVHPVAATPWVIGPCVGVLYTIDANFGSRAHYIGAGGGIHCPLIKGLSWSGHGEVNLITLTKST